MIMFAEEMEWLGNVPVETEVVDFFEADLEEVFPPAEVEVE